MGLISRFRHWQAARNELRIEQLTAKAAELRDDQEYDLVFLFDRGFLRAKATGQSITRISAEVENLVRRRLRVVVSPGTYFVSSGSHQNMVTRREYKLTLSPCSSQRISLDAACINANLPIPVETHRFGGVKRVSDDLARFLEAARDADPMVVQAGVWALTDRYTKQQVQSRLVSRDGLGNTRQAISDEQVARAAQILDGLGISHGLGSHQSERVVRMTSTPEFGTRVNGRVVQSNPEIRGAAILPRGQSETLYVTLANIAAPEDMPRSGDQVEIEFVKYEVGDKVAVFSGPDGSKWMGHKATLIRRRG